MRCVVFDAEIVNSIDPKAGIGWKDFDKMHISVACAFDYATGDYHVFLQDNMQGLIDLLEGADLVAAFNNLNFDNPLIAAEAQRLELTINGESATQPGVATDFLVRLNAKSYDMLEESRKGWGWKGGRFPVGFRLDEHLQALWGAEMMKTEDGAQAPILWREGKFGKVIDYCLADVRRERQLFEWAWYGGQFKCAGSKGHAVKPPQAQLGIQADARLPYFGGPFSDSAVNTIVGRFKLGNLDKGTDA